MLDKLLDSLYAPCKVGYVAVFFDSVKTWTPPVGSFSNIEAVSVGCFDNAACTTLAVSWLILLNVHFFYFLTVVSYMFLKSAQFL